MANFHFCFGQFLMRASAAPLGDSARVIALNENTDEYRSVFRAPRNDTITHVGLHYYDKTGTPVAHRVALCAIGTTNAYGDNTILQGTGEAYADFTPTALTNNTYYEFALTTPCVVTKGQLFVVRVYTTGTPDGSNYARFQRRTSDMFPMHNGLFASSGTVFCSTAGSMATDSYDYYPSVLLRSATAVYGGFIATEFPTASAVDVSAGNRFLIPAATFSSYKVRGLTFMATAPSAGVSNSFDIEFYAGGAASDTTLAATTTLSQRNLDAFDSYRLHDVFFDDEITCDGDTVYRYALRRTAATNSFGVNMLTVPSAMLEALPGGADMYSTTRGAGNWTDLTTRIALVWPIISEVTQPSGSTIIQPNFNQGFN